jgi:ribosomal protein S18 acetylase RimI-like enzyme
MLDEHRTALGMLTLAVCRIPSGVRAWIEDVVVDEAAQGRGVGRALTRHERVSLRGTDDS